jgi:predicted enzyme related to lactoylglutathione lyase
MPRVVHFEINASDPERASQFYESVFGWRSQKWEGPFDYWMIVTGPDSETGINGGMNKKDTPGVVNTIGVESIDDSLAKITASGGKIAAPKMEIPGVGWLAYCIDTEGNPFGVMQSTM